MSTGTPETIRFLQLDHPIGEPACWHCVDFEASLCEEPRCEGRVHEEVETFYKDETGVEVMVIRLFCDSCATTSTYEWWEDLAEEDELEEDDDAE